MSTKGKRSQVRESNLAQKYQTPGQCTTVMIRNIPNEYTQDDLIQEVGENMGSSELFDFFYLPWDSQNDGNIGYAFVNFLDSLTAQKAVRIFSNYKFRLHDSKKVGKVSPAHIQGLENNLRHLQDRAVVHGNHPCSPVVMWRGNKIELSAIFQELRTQDTLQKFGAPQSVPGRPRVGRGWPDDLRPEGPPAPSSSSRALEPPGLSAGLVVAPRSMPSEPLPPPPGAPGFDGGVGECFAQVLDRAAGLSMQMPTHWATTRPSATPGLTASVAHLVLAPGAQFAPQGRQAALERSDEGFSGSPMAMSALAPQVAKATKKQLDVSNMRAGDFFEAEEEDDDDVTGAAAGHTGVFVLPQGHVSAPRSAPSAGAPVLYITPPASAPAFPAAVGTLANRFSIATPGSMRVASLRGRPSVALQLPSVTDISSSGGRSAPPGLTPTPSNLDESISSPGPRSPLPSSDLGSYDPGLLVCRARGTLGLGSGTGAGAGNVSPLSSSGGMDPEQVIALNTRFEGLSTRATPDVELFQRGPEAAALTATPNMQMPDARAGIHEIAVGNAHDDVLNKFFNKFGS